ncbi:hypothetical protein IPJ63_03735 [Candidatus Nomurabacteria bacterium]|nr:MAG: hypothetical protein IPJ63_03735 [Candidatus Nomurabacteria bacterium]
MLRNIINLVLKILGLGLIRKTYYKAFEPNNISLEYRIIAYKSGNKERFVIEKRKVTDIIWTPLLKDCLDVYTKRWEMNDYGYAWKENKYTYRDRHGRGFAIVKSNGNCETYEQALEFISYQPGQVHMQNEDGESVIQLWANNQIARNFVGDTRVEKHVSRIGIFYSNKDTFFESNGPYWEEYFERVYNHKKIA